MIHVCNVHTESYSPAQHGRSVVAEDRGIWNPILNIGPYVTIDIDTARGKSSGQRCGGCCVRTRESQGQGAHCTVYSVQCTPAGPGLWRHGHSDSYSYLQHPALLRSWDHHLEATQPSPSHLLLICDHLLLLLGDCDSEYRQGDGCC